jgi:hypothetical protein
MENIIAQLEYNKIIEIINEIIVQDNSYLAFNIVRDIENLNKDENKSLYDKVQSDQFKKIIVRLKVVCLPSLKEKEIIDLFEYSVVDFLGDEYLDILSKLKTYLISIPDFSARDVSRRKLREALMRNSQLIGLDNIDLAEDQVKPEVKSWLKKYSVSLGSNSAGSFAVNQFLSADKDVLKLTPENINKLRSLLGVFEYLKLSSQTPEGLEDPVIFNINGQLKVLKGGKFEDIKLPASAEKMIQEIKSVDNKTNFVRAEEEPEEFSSSNKEALLKDDDVSSKEQEEIIKAYQGDLAKQQIITNEEERLRKLGDKISMIRQEFFASVQRKQVAKTIACLKVLAEKNDLGLFVKEDEKLNVFLKAVWQKRYGDEFIKEFIANPGQPKYIKLFLQYVLEERLGMSENDAARVGAQIGNIFANLGQQEFTQMAFFDLPTKQFKWFEE